MTTSDHERALAAAELACKAWDHPMPVAVLEKVIEAYIAAAIGPCTLHQLHSIKIAAEDYVGSVNGEPEKDCWDTEDGKPAPGAERFASDWSWREYDAKKQKAFDDLRAALRHTEGDPDNG